MLEHRLSSKYYLCNERIVNRLPFFRCSFNSSIMQILSLVYNFMTATPFLYTARRKNPVKPLYSVYFPFLLWEIARKKALSLSFMWTSCIVVYSYPRTMEFQHHEIFCCDHKILFTFTVFRISCEEVSRIRLFWWHFTFKLSDFGATAAFGVSTRIMGENPNDR